MRIAQGKRGIGGQREREIGIERGREKGRERRGRERGGGEGGGREVSKVEREREHRHTNTQRHARGRELSVCPVPGFSWTNQLINSTEKKSFSQHGGLSIQGKVLELDPILTPKPQRWQPKASVTQVQRLSF